MTPRNPSSRRGRLAAALVAGALLLAACGDSDDDTTSDALPPADDTTGQPATAGACLEGEPDCDDVGVSEDPQSLPDDGEAPVVDGALTVADVAGDGNVIGPVTVVGFLVDDGTTIRLCEALAESFPPQCGGASVPVDGYDGLGLPLSSEGDVTWTDVSVEIAGEMIDGTLVATEVG